MKAKLQAMIKIGILREEKIPEDYRVPFTPKQCKAIQGQYPEIHFVVQPSEIRTYPIERYAELGIEVKEDVSDCDYLFGVKEVRTQDLIANKPYFFFSHTKKAQPYNQGLMHTLIEKKIRMIDYECLTEEDGQRIVGFGKWAGIVGAHNGLLTYGKKYGKFDLPSAHNVEDYEELKTTYEKINWPPMKIVVTGGGRVATGLLEIMAACSFKQVNEDDFINKTYDEPVFVHLDIDKLYARMDDSSFDKDDFFANAAAYCCPFGQYTHHADILMNGIYWEENIPRYFKKEDIQDERFKMNVIADVTCDKYGSVPINLGATPIDDPVYGIDKKTFEKVAGFQNTNDVIDIMTVDNLPSELPKNASEHFGNVLSKHIIPEILKADRSIILQNATICEQGKLTEQFEYLSEYAYV